MIMALSTLITRHADRRPTPQRTGREDNAVARVREYIHSNYSRNIELEELANAAGLSMYHLIRVFQKETGLPPHAYLTHLRVSRAKKLLDLNLPLSQIALDTGFTDQSHFTRHFKRITGVTPGQYR
jgi:transcriptional regulator GlxA family with amidase domain